MRQIWTERDIPNKEMDCVLCKKPIKEYTPAYNRLKIDESISADICSECIDKFLKWQQGLFSDLFPTKAAKKRYGKDKGFYG